VLVAHSGRRLALAGKLPQRYAACTTGWKGI
jgi:hypothetical protein